jgi:hypothetical protein
VAEAIRVASCEAMPLLRARINPQTPKLVASLLEGKSSTDLFPEAASPDCALAGLWLRAGGWEQAHAIAQNVETREGFYWHALVHRQEPDGFNAKYWLRQVGEHPIFPALARPRSPAIAQAATELQAAEWQLLFDFCAGSRTP